MNTDIWAHESLHLVGESATCPSEPRCGRLAALLLLVGMSPPRRRALPNTHIAAHSGTFNCRF